MTIRRLHRRPAREAARRGFSGLGKVKIMKATLFVRPNLKMFLLAALVIAVLREFVLPADSSPFRAQPASSVRAEAMLSDEALERIVNQALSQPTSQRFAFLSECYQKRGDYRQAML